MNNSVSSLSSLGLILLAAVLLQTIAVAVTFIYFNNALSTIKETFSRSSVSCLMGTSNNDFSLNREEGIHDPCGQVTQQLRYRIEKTMSYLFKKEISSAVKDNVARVLPSLTAKDQDSPHLEIAAHLTGKFLAKEERAESPPSSTVLGQKIQAWESGKGLAFLHNVEMSDGELIFSRAGLYYVYSQTYFRHSQLGEEEEGGEAGSEDATRSRQMLQYIYKKVRSYPMPILLMKNARTNCWSRDQEYGLYSIYQAGIAQLSAGDRVFVTVSNISTMDMDGRSSFFGAFLVT